MSLRIRRLTPDDHRVRRLARELPCSQVLARLLTNRGLDDPAAARQFLNPDLADLPVDAVFKGMRRAVERIARAVLSGERILVFGDYDVDGVTATAVLCRFLEEAGANVDYYIPHRVEEGYGLNVAQVASVLVPSGCSLVVTADCGSGSQAAVAAAVRAGIDLVVTDHHQIPQPPEALAVINPMQADCPSGMRYLSGVGVAFFLVLHLRKHLREQRCFRRRPEPNLKRLCDLVALGTVADMVPLVEANRILTRIGLEQIAAGAQPGVRALTALCNLDSRPLDAQDISFRLAPRINAAGRMGHAATAAELLLAPDPVSAERLAAELIDLNRRRQMAESRLMSEIDALLAERPEWVAPHSLVLSGRNWHPGILGIAAAKLVRRYNRPVVLLATDGSHAKGSARSIVGLDVVAAIARSRRFLSGFGGHSMAAGLQLPHVHIDAFREAFESAAAAGFQGRDLTPEIAVDDRLAVSDLSPALMDDLARLGPFGNGNPEPVFVTEAVDLVSSRRVGAGHQRLVLRSSADLAGPKVEAMRFDGALQEVGSPGNLEVVFRLRWNHWQGRRRIQLILE
jgi:single-stranded-DNA-specific exonuclease